ncbi:hypothetical protein ACH9L7_00805 [Haloferax sp. S1W]|uniref:DUF7344 domain-containing protein n=1 Tax=Haloferax sp. S1W TaxID=3377110 RepID=UPI0037C71592
MTESERDQTGEETRGCDIPLDTVFDLLSDCQRRAILRYLTRHSDSIELAELADKLAACEKTDGDDPKRLSTSLYHVHLPKLADGNVLTFDPETGIIELEPESTVLAPYLDLASGCES